MKFFKHWRLLGAGALITTVALAAGYERISKDKLLLGAGSSSDKTLEFDVGSLNNPYFKYDQSEGKLKFSDDGLNEKSFGTGEGGANYVPNASGADGVSGWTDANTTLSVTTSSNPSNLDTALSFDLAASVSGGSEEEVYVDITIGDNDKNRMLQVLTDFLVDANFLDDVLEIQVVADPLGTPITLNVQNALLKARNGRHMATFATTDASVYRVKLFRDSGVTLSGVSIFKFNRFTVNSEGIPGETIVTEWEDFTPTGSLSTNVTYSGRYRRVGEDLSIYYKILMSGAPSPAGTLTLNMPTGLTIASGVGDSLSLGRVEFVDVSSATHVGGVFRQSASVMFLRYLATGGSTAIYTTASDVAPVTTWVSGDSIEVRVDLKSGEWQDSGTTTFMSDSVVYANAQVRYYAPAGTVTGGSAIPYDTESTLLSKVGDWSLSSGVVTFGTKGRYRISVFNSVATPGLVSPSVLSLNVNGAPKVYLDLGDTGQLGVGGTSTLDLEVGDTLEVSVASTFTTVGGDLSNYLEIVRMADYSAGQPVGSSVASLTDWGLLKGVVYDSGNIGIGGTPVTKFQVVDGSSGGATYGFAEMIVESDNATANGIQIKSPAGGSGRLSFGDPAASTPGQINYSHATDAMLFSVGSVSHANLNLSGAEFGTGLASSADYNFHSNLSTTVGIVGQASDARILLYDDSFLAWRIFNDQSASDTLKITDDSVVGVTLAQGATSWGTTSDWRLKENWEDIEDANSIIKAWRVGQYNLITQDKTDVKIGLVAQDVDKTLPHVVDKTDSEAWNIRYMEIVPILTKAIQEQQSQIKTLKDWVCRREDAPDNLCVNQ